MIEQLPLRPAGELTAAIRRREVSAVEAVEAQLAHIEAVNPAVNAVVCRTDDAARRRAAELDAALAAGEPVGPLHGVPITVKESYDVAGLPTTWGYPELAGNVAAADAVAVRRLSAAGAVLVGKTNVPTGVADFQSYNPIYGTTNNPWDLGRSPGGSSGGSAAALAAGLATLEIGSDNGSSIRNPAHYCGVYGHKPTYGIVPTRGHRAPGSTSVVDLAAHGPLARAAADLTLALEVLAGGDPVEQPGWTLTLPPPRATRLEEFRVAVMLDHPEFPVDATVLDRLRAAVSAVSDAGVQVTEVGLPAGFAAREVFAHYLQLLWGSIGGRLPADKLAWARDTVGRLPDDDDSVEAQVALAYTLSHGQWLRANEARNRLRAALRGLFTDVDVLLMPVHATTAFPHDQSAEQWRRTRTVNGTTVNYWDNLFWSAYGAACNLPATVAPVGLARDGLPVGLQILGPEFGDWTTLAFAEALETAGISGYLTPPLLTRVPAAA